MASRYNFSLQRKSKITGNLETFQVVECNSWEEARAEVEKAIRDQELLEEKSLIGKTEIKNSVPISKTSSATDEIGKTTVPSGNQT